jgi:hypothetical protein
MFGLAFQRVLYSVGYRTLASRSPLHRRAARCVTTSAEVLEARCLLTVDLTPLEQYVLELVNRARANPTGEAQRFGLSDLNQGLSPGTISATPKAPLAPNQLLLNAARAHSQDMFTRNYFEHTNPEGKSPGDRIAATGYPFTTWGENIAFYSEGRFRTPTATELEFERNNPEWAERHHEGLFESPGHRTNLLRDSFRELGPGVTVDPRGSSIVSYATQNFGTRSGNPLLLGVVYLDTTTADQFYTIGEGQGGVTITATSQSSGQSFTTTTGTAGGYVLQVPNGTYTVVASGGRLASPVPQGGITVSGANAKSDFRLTSLAPAVNQPPVAGQPAIGLLTALQQGGHVLLYPAATFADADSTTTGGGTVVVSIASPAGTDRLSVFPQGTGAGQIWVSGNQITFSGAALGTFTGGTGTTALTITLASSATPAGVEALLRALRYESTATSPVTSSRAVTATITDGLSNSTSITRDVRIAPLKTASDPVRFQRAYNPNADYHFFTTSAPEFNNAVSAGYLDETTGQPGFSVVSDYVAGTALIHRLYNLTTGRHYYTVSAGERDSLVRIGWRFEKDEGFMSVGLAAGLTEVFRLYNRNSGVHLYTENAGAKDVILASFPGIWEQHTSLGFARAAGTDGVTRSSGSLIVAAAEPGTETPVIRTTVVTTTTLAIAVPPPAAALASVATLGVVDTPAANSAPPRVADSGAETDSLDTLFAGDFLTELLPAW